MFESLDEQMKSDEHKATNARERLMKWLIGTAVMAATIVGLYIGFSQINGS
ncbi:MAG TPA: hypothetical protein VHD76_10035 [Bryobacteraceae bacterium]|jgi:hypothetical protein|nr:hypothetical protein [Bryobacteraceae bacterium]